MFLFFFFFLNPGRDFDVFFFSWEDATSRKKKIHRRVFFFLFK